MSSWGRIDSETFANPVGVTQNDATVTKNAADSIDVGQTIELAGVSYFVMEVTSNTSIELHKPYEGTTNSSLSGAVRRTPPTEVAQYIIKGGDTSPGQLIFADSTEGGLANNKARGIWGPGWWLYKTYEVGGTSRHKAECLVHMSVASGVSGDAADDTIAADELVVITVSGQPPAAISRSVGSSGSNTITAIATPPGNDSVLTYQWQKLSSTGVWEDVSDPDISGTTTKRISFGGAPNYNGFTVGMSGSYRCVINSTNGAAEVITNTMVMTVS
tara:strand:- start:1603 stop:2421 length:819 start_codon:yes stop_codon:yes gene_type:complete